MRAGTGVGSMPGTDFTDSLQVILGEVGDLPFLPELPTRGPHGSMIGRTLALLDGLGVDLQPDGWRAGVGDGVDIRRARSLLGQDLDVTEEFAGSHVGAFKIQLVGPLTLAASVERPRGDKMLADHGARRELAESLAAGLVTHIADVQRRLPSAELWVQVDEPSIVAVMSGGIPTASGFSRHRSVGPPEADALLCSMVKVIADAGARPVVHSCAPNVPTRLLADAGFSAISFDVSLAKPDDVWAEAFESGVDLWAGSVPSSDSPTASPATVGRSVQRFFSRLGFDPGSYEDRLVVTPTCGLAGASPTWARSALTLAQTVASSD